MNDAAMDLMTVEEVATELGVSKGAIYKALSNSELRHYRIGAAIRISRQHLEEWLQAIEIQAVNPRTTHRQSFRHLDL
ncbi:MAG: helix-turn-helix domain-containing protein [Planctomycetaceae bacterium]|nr:helix-turn-helix domain-containing protein [Planctomycetaceae bacterium]